MLLLRCPLCNRPIGEVEGQPGTRVRVACHYRRCAGRPRVMFEVTEKHTIRRVSLDAGRRVAVA